MFAQGVVAMMQLVMGTPAAQAAAAASIQQHGLLNMLGLLVSSSASSNASASQPWMEGGLSEAQRKSAQLQAARQHHNHHLPQGLTCPVPATQKQSKPAGLQSEEGSIQEPWQVSD